jgi:hypothetical protein
MNGISNWGKMEELGLVHSTYALHRPLFVKEGHSSLVPLLRPKVFAPKKVPARAYHAHTENIRIRSFMEVKTLYFFSLNRQAFN